MTYDPNLDFNTEEDFKAPALVPDGVYHANITSVLFDPEASVIIWVGTLAENGGLCSDGETEIDGTQHKFTLWLPKEGDELEMTKSGKMTKRQGKINQFKRFTDEMKLKENSVAEMISMIDGAEYLTMGVGMRLETNEFPKGNMFTKVRGMFVN